MAMMAADWDGGAQPECAGLSRRRFVDCALGRPQARVLTVRFDTHLKPLLPGKLRSL
jgi:hypothetical protein